MEIGAKIGPYRILRALGQGGMGEVLHPSYARHAQTVARFFNEARAVNRIEHPSLVQIHEHGGADSIV